jgi:hypothetical protein
MDEEQKMRDRGAPMKKWGLVVTLFYGLIVVALLAPVTLILASDSFPSVAGFKEAYASGAPWICAIVLMLGAALLLWLSADTTQKRLKPRTHILVSALMTGLLTAILTVAIALALGFAFWGDKLFPNDDPSVAAIISVFAVPWLFWAILFYRLTRNSSDAATRTIAWLLRGSVLELLIAVPAHVIMRRRHDCSAPAVNSFGIGTGIAIMLLSFGPGVLLLFKRRMEKHPPK